MKQIAICALLINLTGCNTYLPDASRAGGAPSRTELVTIRPIRPELSNPAVATDKGLVAYVDDLETCRTKVSSAMGGRDTDDLAAIQRAISGGPIDGKLTVRYAATDRAVVRDKSVRNCLSGKGHLVSR